MRNHRNSLVAGFLLMLALVVPFAPAQQLGTEKGLRAAFDGDKKLRGLMNGTEPAKKGDEKSAEIAANYFIFRVTHTKNDKKPTEAYDDFKSQVGVMMEKIVGTDKPRQNREFINMFGPALIASMTQVLDRDIEKDPSTVIAAAMMLPQMARLKEDHVGDYLLEIIDMRQSAKEKKYFKGKPHDVLRLYALKGLKEYFPITPLDNFSLDDVKKVQGLLNDTKYVEGLRDYILFPVNVKGLTSEELEAKRYVRREAIAALAQAGAPAALALKAPVKLGKEAAMLTGKPALQAEGLAAPTLLKVLANDLPTLPPSLQEKLEAANGLCNMNYAKMPDYNANVALFLVGRTLQEFISEYDKDWVNFAGKNKLTPMLPWKSEARRLEASLAQMQKAGGKGATELYDAAKPTLTSISGYLITEAPKKNVLNKLVPTLRPIDGKVFKTVAAPPIPLPK